PRGLPQEQSRNGPPEWRHLERRQGSPPGRRHHVDAGQPARRRHGPDAGRGDYAHAWIRGEERSLDWREARKFQPFDFAYALTCHKAQGSQWDSVVIFDQSHIFEDAKSWLYTAVTRAAEKVTVVL